MLEAITKTTEILVQKTADTHQQIISSIQSIKSQIDGMNVITQQTGLPHREISEEDDEPIVRNVTHALRSKVILTSSKQATLPETFKKTTAKASSSSNNNNNNINDGGGR
jgi:hypothetical protein